MAKNNYILIRATPEQRERLHQIAGQQHMTLTALILSLIPPDPDQPLEYTPPKINTVGFCKRCLRIQSPACDDCRKLHLSRTDPYQSLVPPTPSVTPESQEKP